MNDTKTTNRYGLQRAEFREFIYLPWSMIGNHDDLLITLTVLVARDPRFSKYQNVRVYEAEQHSQNDQTIAYDCTLVAWGESDRT